MNGYLLDTSVVLIASTVPEKLSPRIRRAVDAGPALLSTVSYREVTIKAMKGGLDLGNPRVWWAETLEALGLQPLMLNPRHIAAVCDLPPIHQDPFDRALIAQAIEEDLTLLTTDRLIPRYASPRLRVIQ
ncbi:MAG: type II toxin-antitoxin system VapC family toxin [Bryobacterales bacterium]|nr:type II toxin-antitoxin system VapC family toxin [Bryobacterales bacterium]MBV9399256.1 type II toxin-antitoxin system VapC family toxin [Bryobacterales bacterium]